MSDVSQPQFTSELRTDDGGPPAFSSPDERVVEQTSVAFGVVRKVSHVPGLRRVAGAPVPQDNGHTRASDVVASPLYRRFAKLRGSELYRRAWLEGMKPAVQGRRGARAQARADVAAGVGSRRIDEAIDLLQSIPFEEIQRRGWHFQPNHFYWPLNDVAFLRSNPELWHDRGLPRAIDWDLDRQLEHARRIAPYYGELADVPFEPEPGVTRYVWNNGAFSGADAIAYYGLVRERAPRRVVEVGSGWSSLMLARALERNDSPCDVTIVEPFPNEEVFAGLPSGWDVHRAIIQHADLAIFERLRAGDILFYDGSHCVGTASDVTWFFFEVLPRLAPGVLVHVHDIFFPADYHDEWVFDEGLSWNEQYLLQAFLMHNDAYRVHLANATLAAERSAEMAELYPADGGSVWIEKVR